MPARPKFDPKAIDTSVFGTIRKASGNHRVENAPVTKLDPRIIKANPWQPRRSQITEAEGEDAGI